MKVQTLELIRPCGILKAGLRFIYNFEADMWTSIGMYCADGTYEQHPLVWLSTKLVADYKEYFMVIDQDITEIH